MGESSDNNIKQYVDCPLGESKTCLIHGPGNYSDECKVLGDFGAKYPKGKPTKYHGNIHLPRKEFKRQQEIMSLLIM